MNTHTTLAAVTGILTNFSILLNNGDTTMESSGDKLRPVINTPSDETEKADSAAPSFKVPGTEYDDVHEAVLHLRGMSSNPQRNEYNETLDFTYANLAEILDMLRQPLYQHGLIMTQTPERVGEGFDMVTTFNHVPSKTSLSYRMPMTMKNDRRLDDCQRFGAALTYFKRYAIRDVFGVTDGDDDIDQGEARKQRRREKREAEAGNKARVWAPAHSERTKEESILNVLVAAGRVKDATLISQAKAKNCALVTPSEEEFIQTVESTYFDSVYTHMLTLMPEIAAQRASGEYPDYGQQIWRYRQLWLKACQQIWIQRLPVDVVIEGDEALSEDASLIAKRDAYRAKVQSGEIVTHSEDDDEIDQIVNELKSGDIPLPPFGEDPKLPAVDLESEHAVLMRQKVILCREIAEGIEPKEEKIRLINQVLSRADFQSSQEINLIIARLTNPGAPLGSVEDDEIPY